MNRYISKFLLMAILPLAIACTIDPTVVPVDPTLEGYRAINPPANFNFAVVDQVSFQISGVFSDKTPLSGVKYEIYNGNPLADGKKISTFVLNNQGSASVTMMLAADIKELYLYTEYIGLPPVKKITINRPQTQVKIDPSVDSFDPGLNDRINTLLAGARVASVPSGFTAMGSFNTNGLPSYLVTNDVINKGLLERLNANLPEQKDLRVTNLDLLDEKYSRQMKVTEDADIWVTFVHNGAGWKNTLGYYFYENDDKPKSIDEIKEKIIIYPNISALTIGNKVKLKGNLPNGGFKKGTTVGWFILSDGWKSGAVTTGRAQIYSDRNLNTFITNSSLREHMVFLYDQIERVMLIGWEDQPRTAGDQDFNDVVFYATWNPITSVELGDYAILENIVIEDKDGDGIKDNVDEFPNDPDRAFTNFFPSKGTYGTFLFEDLWPSYGDFDMNDLVLGFNSREITDGQGRVKEMQMAFVIRGVGASLKNGFGVELGTNPENIESVKGNRLTTGNIKLNGNGTEANQSKAVVIIFDDANLNIKGLANVFKDNAHQSEDTIKVNVVFKFSIPKKDLAVDPLNAFLFRSDDRGLEVHLMNGMPTSLATKSYFRTKDDKSDFNAGVFYRSGSGLNWAIFVPEEIAYPIESRDFTKGYLRFADWAKSGGNLYKDWYRNQGDNINPEVLYKKK